MRAEDFVHRSPNRDLAPLMKALQTYGATFIVTGWESDRAVTVGLQMPEDEYRERRCRRLIDAWRTGSLRVLT